MTYAPLHLEQYEVSYLNWVHGEGNVSYGRREAIEADIDKAWALRRPELTPEEIAEQIGSAWFDLVYGCPWWDGPHNYDDYVDPYEWRDEVRLYRDEYALPLWVDSKFYSQSESTPETPAWIKQAQDEGEAEFVRSERRHIRDTSPRNRRRDGSVKMRGTGSSGEAYYRRLDRRLQRYTARTQITEQLAS